MINLLRLLVLLLCLTAGCRNPHKSEDGLLKKYAQREGIPEAVLKEQGKEWPQYLKDYSESHGPTFNREEQRQFRSWQVK